MNLYTHGSNENYLISFLAIAALLTITICFIPTVHANSSQSPNIETTAEVHEETCPPETTDAEPTVFVFPLDGKITSEFAWRDDPFYDPTDGGVAECEFHRGIDISAAHSRDIQACSNGIVSYVGKSTGYGNYIMIDHDGFVSLYAHCSEILCNIGDQVSAGDSIAIAGATGRATGVHLHFEIRVNGEFVDPLDYVGSVYTGATY